MDAKVSLKKNAILNIIKQILKIAFPLITFPYVSRILHSENLGKYNFSLSIINYFSLIAGLGVNSYAIREGARLRESKSQFNKFACQVFTINIFTTLISYGLLVFLMITWKKLSDYRMLVIIQSTTILFTTLGTDWINSIYEDYEYMTKRYIFVKVISLICIFILVKKKNDYLIYAGIVTGSEILANLVNIFYIKKYTKIRISKESQFIRHIVPLLILFSNSMAITIYSNSDITMLGFFKGDVPVGIYSVASKMYQIAKNLINAIIIVIIPRLAALLGEKNRNAYNGLLMKTLKAIMSFVFPIAIGMMMLGNEIIFIIGGKEYLSGAIALQLLCIGLFPAAINSIFFDGILIVNRAEIFCLISTIISAIINVLLNLVLIPLMSYVGAAITTVIAEIVGCVLAIYFSRKQHEMKFTIDKDIVSIFMGSIGVIGICLLIGTLTSGILKVIVSIILSVLLYGYILYIMKNSFFMNLGRSLSERLSKGNRERENENQCNNSGI